MQDPLGLIGKKIDDKYQVEELVGEGGFAVVYRAQHLIFKRPVAIKAFRAMSDIAVEQRDRLLDDFTQEGRLLADLSERSAAIVQARDVGTIMTANGDWVPYMVLEWLDGSPLDAVLTNEKRDGMMPRSIEQVVKLLEPVAEALALAHKRGIAHRDVKPANIFLLGEPRADDCAVKLLDFGIAKVVQDAQKMAGSFNKTQGTVTSFTPAYGAPEQFSRTHGATGPWTDVFSLALVIGELLTHKPPLEGDDFVQLGFASANTTIRPTPRKLGAAVSDEVEAVFAKAVAVSPEARYQGAGEFWNALREALHMAPMRPIAMSMTNALKSDPALSSASTFLAPPSSPPPAAGSNPNVPSAPVPASMTVSSNMASSGNVPPQASGGGSKLALVAGGLLVAVAAAVLGFTVLHKGGAAPVAPSSVASASAAPPPAPTCPAGMIYIEGGEFYMGSSDPRALDNEKPAHSVTLSPFCIDKTEVTVEAYRACSETGKCPAASRENYFNGFDDLRENARNVLNSLCNVTEPIGKASHPINCVSWEKAANFCSRKTPNGRLPTEAEWEFAARGPDGRAYPWGDEPPSARFLNACGSECTAWSAKNHLDGIVTFGAMYKEDDKFPTTAPVGSFPEGKSRYGLYDVDGNVWEWTADYFAEYTKDPQKDPAGPKSGEDRVARGGAWNGGDPSWERPTFRFHFPPKNESYGIGFRCAAQATTR